MPGREPGGFRGEPGVLVHSRATRVQEQQDLGPRHSQKFILPSQLLLVSVPLLDLSQPVNDFVLENGTLNLIKRSPLLGLIQMQFRYLLPLHLNGRPPEEVV